MNGVLEKEKSVGKHSETNERREGKKSKNKGSKFGRFLKKFFITVLILFIISAGILAGLLYGPYNGFRDWLITSAMTTMTHQWIAEIFYSDETIKSVMDNNKVESSDEETDTSAIVIDKEEEKEPEKIEYKNEYERAVLEKENPDDEYKIFNITAKGYNGYMAVIYDPSKVKTIVSSNVGVTGQYLTDMARNNKAVVAINGGNFKDTDSMGNGGLPTGITYSKGKFVYARTYRGSGGIVGFDKNDKLVLSKKCTQASAKKLNIRDCVTCTPFLIVNGKASKIVGNGGWGYAPRTAIGQRKDGIVLFLVIDGRRINKPGASIKDLIEIMQNYGAYNASALDGGTSSAMVENYKLVNDPMDASGAHRTRPVATGFGLILDNKKK